MYLVFLSLADVYSSFGSAWIDFLYQQSPDILSYPADLKRRAYCRKAFLFLGFFFLLSLTASESSFAVICYQLILSAFLLLTIDTDFEQYVIFDRMLLPFGILSLPFLLLMPFGAIISHLLAALGGGVLFFLLAVLTRGGIGGGDIKLIFVLGLWLGAWPLAAVILGGFFLGGISAALLMLFGKKGKHDFFAYGPYFSFVALAVTYIKP